MLDVNLGREAIILSSYPFIFLGLIVSMFLYSRWLYKTRGNITDNLVWVMLLSFLFRDAVFFVDEFFWFLERARGEFNFGKVGLGHLIFITAIKCFTMLYTFFFCVSYYFCFYNKSVTWLFKTTFLGYSAILALYMALSYLLW